MKEIYLDESEEKLTVDEIQSFEKKIGKIFPNDFKKFLLKSNGGYPREELFTHPFIEINPNTNIEFVQETDVEKFFSLNEMEFEYGDIVDEDYISEEYVPFARTSFGNLLLIRLDESEFNGNIYFSNHDLFNSKKNKFTISKVCNSFNEFIDCLNEKLKSRKSKKICSERLV